MKIKVLTFSKALNYGAILQSYALSETLKKYGHDVELIDLPLIYDKSDDSSIVYKLIKILFNFNLLYTKIRNKIIFYYKNKLMSEFRNQYFPKFINYNDVLKNIENNLYDEKETLFVVGSDQVWNPNITGCQANEFFLGFVPSKYKKISYAASFGFDDTEILKSFQINRDILKDFSFISVRELSGVSICKDFFNVNASFVLDPTLLIDNYFHLIPKVYNNKTIIGYRFIENKGWSSLLKHISKERNIEKIKYNLHNKPVSVNYWLKYIYEADFVVTDSYHVMVFSILFNKNFIVFPSYKDRVDRIHSLLNSLDLSERYYDCYEYVYINDKWKNNINYDVVNSKLDKLRKESLELLLSNF